MSSPGDTLSTIPSLNPIMTLIVHQPSPEYIMQHLDSSWTNQIYVQWLPTLFTNLGPSLCTHRSKDANAASWFPIKLLLTTNGWGSWGGPVDLRQGVLLVLGRCVGAAHVEFDVWSCVWGVGLGWQQVRIRRASSMPEKGIRVWNCHSNDPKSISKSFSEMLHDLYAPGLSYPCKYIDLRYYVHCSSLYSCQNPTSPYLESHSGKCFPHLFCVPSQHSGLQSHSLGG